MGKKLKVLVVDDDRSMVKTICDILRVNGYEALPAYSGEEGVETAGAVGPDCVLMDIKMPGIDGVDALKRIKELSPDLPVVLMSAYATEDRAEEAKEEGAHAVLTKPVDVQLVLSFLSILGREECVLVVDDDPLFCRTLEDMLRSRGFRVETESDPARVLGHMEHEYKLAVILDLKLGTVDGLDVLKDIRGKYPEKPVVLVAGHGEGGASAEKGLATGAYTCFDKPLETEELIGVIEEISRGKLRALLGETFERREVAKWKKTAS